MKTRILFLLTFLVVTTLHAQDFAVTNYEVDVYISAEGYFDVVEKYDLNFKYPKHGIYRDIRTHYDVINAVGASESRDIRISNIEVPNYQFDATGAYMRKVGGNLNIKIGDPNKTLEGAQHYEIKYRVTNAFLYEADATRFYWNLKPTKWMAVFQDMQFRIHLPENTAVGSEDYFVYSGAEGNTTPTTEFTTHFKNSVLEGNANPNFVSTYGMGVTILIDLPPGSIAEIKPFWPFWNRYGWLIVIGSLIAAFYFLWRKFGKDKRVIATISYFPPEKMDPAMAGFLINDKDDTSDLISLIPYWGSRGHLKMEVIEKKGWFAKEDTKVTKLANLPDDAPSYQKKVFNGLFSSGSNNEVLISSLKDSFYTTMSSAKALLKKEAQRYYEPKSRAVRNILAGVLILVCALLSPVVLYLWGALALVAWVVSTIVLLVLNIFMIKKNTHGNKVFGELKGFKQFIKTAEEDKLKMLLSESPIYFESTMGYALTFGAFAVWANKFSALNVPPPSWYTGSGGSHSSMHNFSRSFAGTMSTTSSTMVSAPSSSSSGGGGSSGGGFGGGGGGSW